jgi:hypothetical protein
MRTCIALSCLAIVVGCQVNRQMTSAGPRFRVASAIEPGTEAGTFVVTTRIDEMREGNWQHVAAPRVTIRSGQSAYIILDGDRKIRVDATATGDAEGANGSVKVDVSKGNQPLYGSEQQLMLATRRS